MFKKFLSIVFIMILIMNGSISLAYALPYSGSGQGTEANPYIIENVEQLKGISNNLNAYYKLGSDIDLGNQYWQPIGSTSYPFKGGLDGDGHKIKNLTIKNQNYAGLFAYVNGAKIKNLTIENVNISGEKISSGGGLIGQIFGGQIDDCKVTGTIVINSSASSGSSAEL